MERLLSTMPAGEYIMLIRIYSIVWAKEVKPENEATCILTYIFHAFSVCTM